jgi:type IV pilus assembly protein PilO
MAAKKPAGIGASLSPGARGGLVGLLMVVVAALYYVVYYQETDDLITKAKAEKADLLSELEAQKRAQATFLSDRDELVLRQQRQRELNKILPEATEVASFLSSLQQVSNLSGVELVGWQPLEERNESFYARSPMQLELRGRFHQVAKFVHEVGRLDRIINVENIELFEPKEAGADIVMRARCLATALHQLPHTKAPAAGGGARP